MNFAAIKKIDSLDVLKSINWLFHVTLVISVFKNIVIWKLFRVHMPEYYHMPVISSLDVVPTSIDIAILALGAASLTLLLSKDQKKVSIPYIYNGFVNLYFMFASYTSLHHDMLLSGMIFVIFGLMIFFKGRSPYRSCFSILIAVTAATYLLSGIAKINSDFLSGEMAGTIIERANVFFYWPVMELFLDYTSILAWFAMIVEVVEPIILILFTGILKFYLMLAAFPFHMGILLTGTGTVYNLIYPACFLFILYQQDPEFMNGANLIGRIYKLNILTFLAFAILYTVLMFAKGGWDVLKLILETS